MGGIPTDRLLSGKETRLGVREKEAILAKVLGQKPAKSRAVWAWPLAFAAAAYAVVAYVRIPSQDDTFTARGKETGGVEITCKPGPCRAGDRLYFRMLSAQPKHLAAFAQTPGGEVVWFFPQDEAAATRAFGEGFVDEAPVLPSSLTGDVTVHILVSDTPLTRKDIRARYDGGDKNGQLERSLHVAP